MRDIHAWKGHRCAVVAHLQAVGQRVVGLLPPSSPMHTEPPVSRPSRYRAAEVGPSLGPSRPCLDGMV